MITHATFDSVAATYDDEFTRTPIAQMLRARTRSRLAQFRAGMRVLELGCGTGADAVWLAQRGVEVIATDVSRAMLEQTRAKARAANVALHVETRWLDLNAPTLDMDERFDGAFSNFGALNCVAELAPLAHWLADNIKPGGKLVLVVMGALCPWEIIAHAARGDWRGATRRRRQDTIAHVGAQAVRVQYPRAAALAGAFAPAFRRTHLEAIGVLIPPPYLSVFAARHVRLMRTLARWEPRVAAVFPFNALGDHYLLELVRCGGVAR